MDAYQVVAGVSTAMWHGSVVNAGRAVAGVVSQELVVLCQVQVMQEGHSELPPVQSTCVLYGDGRA